MEKGKDERGGCKEEEEKEEEEGMLMSERVGYFQ